MLDGPIPGMSLTAEYGGRPWQQPPKNTTIEEALSFYMPRLSDETFVPELLKVMELGIPLTTIANAMQTGAAQCRCWYPHYSCANRSDGTYW